MYDNMRISDADRERVTARLREHFAEGRLTQDELNDRISAALSAKTVADLRRVMADLPEPGQPGTPGWPPPPPGWQGPGWQVPPAGWQGQQDWPAQDPWQSQNWQSPQWTGNRQVYSYHRGPRLLPLALLILFTMILLPSAGWMAFAFLKVALVVWLVVFVASLVAAGRRRRTRRGQRYDDTWQRRR